MYKAIQGAFGFEKARIKNGKIQLLFDREIWHLFILKTENTGSGYLVCEMDRTSAYYGKSLSEIEYFTKK